MAHSHHDFDPKAFRVLVEHYESVDHNVLLLRQERNEPASLLSFPVEREGPNAGDYVHPPESAEFRDPGTRKVMGVAREHVFEEPAGPMFSTFPVKPEPGSIFFYCYFVNSKRLNPQRWRYREDASEPPPSLLVAEDSGELRLYESVGALAAAGSEACQAALQAGFIVGTMPNDAAYGGDHQGNTAVVNLTALTPALGAREQHLPDLAIITPHDDAAKNAKVFAYPGVGQQPSQPPVAIPPGSNDYQSLTRLARGAHDGSFAAGAALSLVDVPDGQGNTRCALVISSRNLLYKNEWIRAEWAGPRAFRRIMINVRPSLVVATPDGGLYKYVGGQDCLPLKLNTDTWHQLRNGCVLGTVQRHRIRGTEALSTLSGEAERVPLVNLSSLEPNSGPNGPVLGPGLGLLESDSLNLRVSVQRLTPRFRLRPAAPGSGRKS